MSDLDARIDRHVTRVLKANDLPDVPLSELKELLETAVSMHRMHAVVFLDRWPNTNDLPAPTEVEREFADFYKSLTAFTPKDKSGYRVRYKIVEDTDERRVVRRVFKKKPATKCMYETYGPDSPKVEFEKDFDNSGKQGREPQLKTIEPIHVTWARNDENKKIRADNHMFEATGRHDKKNKELKREEWDWLMSPFLQWCLWYAREWFRENIDPDAELVVAPKTNYNNFTDRFSQCARLAYHMAKCGDDRYHSNNMWHLLYRAKPEQKYYDI